MNNFHQFKWVLIPEEEGFSARCEALTPDNNKFILYATGETESALLIDIVDAIRGYLLLYPSFSFSSFVYPEIIPVVSL